MFFNFYFVQLVVASSTNCRNYFCSVDGDCYMPTNYIVLTQEFLKTVQVSESTLLFYFSLRR